MAKLYCPKCDSTEIHQTKQKAESGKYRWRCTDCRHRTTSPNTKPNQQWFNPSKRQILKNKKFVITSAQNDTSLNVPFFNALLKYCEVENAKLIVIPVRYKNPDSFHNGIAEQYSWPSEIYPYLCDSNIKINDNLTLMGDIKVVATAVNPLQGLDTISGKSSCIIGHAQLAMRMVATPKLKMPKMLHTTGSISLKNYSKTKQGAVGHHHHSFSALVIETEGSKFWFRQLSADDTGGFYDLTKYYTGEKVTNNHSIEALVYGDLHVRHLSTKIKDVTFYNKNSITKTLNPKFKIYHDVHDHESGSHHNEHNHILRMYMHQHGRTDVRKELLETVNFLDSVGGGHVIQSNHHEHLTKWMNSYKKTDLENADLYYQLMELCRLEINKGKVPDPFELYLKKYCKVPLTFVSCDDEFIIKNIDCSQHGDRGANGARPSPRAFANSGNKSIAGHSHQPCIEKGFWSVGTSTTDLEYAKGLSSWLICHAGIYPNGKRVLIPIIDNKWRPSWATQ